MHDSAPWIRRLWFSVFLLTVCTVLFYRGPYLKVWAGGLISLSLPTAFQIIRCLLRIPKTERKCGEPLLDWLGWWIPRRHRGEALADLHEDISDMRKSGLSEAKISRRVIWQLVLLLLSHWKVWKSAVSLWLLAKAREIFRAS